MHKNIVFKISLYCDILSYNDRKEKNMKTWTLLLFLSIMLVFTGCGETQLTEFKCSEGNFSVLMPGTPKHDSRDIKTQVGVVKLNLYSSGSGNEVFMASYSDYPEQYAKTANPDIVLQGAKEGAAKNVNGNILSEEKISSGEVPGLKFDIEVPQKAIMRCKIFLDFNRLYQFMIVAPANGSYTAAQLKFLDSVKLVKNSKIQSRKNENNTLYYEKSKEPDATVKKIDKKYELNGK